MNPKIHFRRSLVWKLFVSVLLCILLLFLLNWLLNNFVLESYYRRAKEQNLVTVYQDLNTVFDQNYSDASSQLYQLETGQNIHPIIWTRQGILWNGGLDQSGGSFGQQGPYFTPPDVSSLAPGKYTLTVNQNPAGAGQDSENRDQFISLCGQLNNGYYILLRTPVASIRESVEITNQFLFFTGGVALLAGILIVLIIARSFTKPVRVLSRIAGNVSRLDFSERYAIEGKDEFAALGSSINAMSEELESNIRSLQTANARLAADNELKTRQNEARKAFIANVSHELKTPIALVQTYAEGLQEDIDGGGENRDFYCGVIEDEAVKMSELIQKMTALMQIEDGSEQLELEEFDISELCANLLHKNGPLLEEKHVSSTAPAGPVTVTADPYLIENVLTNYLSNAIHHVTEGGEVRINAAPTEHGTVKVSVFNTGGNIPEEDLSRIWESFYKVDKARTRAYGGSGIGLSVVAAVMKAHGMPYGVQNHPDGVEFYIELQGA